MLVAVDDGQSLEKLADAIDKVTDVTSRNVSIAHVKSEETNSSAELIQINLKIAE